MRDPSWYRRHPNKALASAFARGERARIAGLPLTPNPYRAVRTTVRARRGSWSESYAQAYAVGWNTEDLRQQALEPKEEIREP